MRSEISRRPSSRAASKGHRITNALAEGTNSKIEWIKNTGRGYRNWDNLKTAIYFHCGGLKLEKMSLRPA